MSRQSSQQSSNTPDTSRFAIVRRHIGKYRRYLLWGGVSVTLAAAFSVVRPYIIKLLLDKLETGITVDYGLRIAGAFLGLTILSGIFLFVSRRTIIWMSRKLEYDIRGELFDRLLRLPLSFYDNNRIGDIMARLTNDVEAVRMMFGPAIMYFANTIVLTILALGIMFYLAPKLTLYIIIPMPFISLTVAKLGGLIHKKFQAIQEQFSTLTAAAHENLSGIRVIKAYSQEAPEIEKFRLLGLEYLKRNMSLARFQGFFQPLLFSMGGLITLIALYFGGRGVINGELSKGTVVSFFVYITLLLWPIIAMGWVVSLYQRGLASLERINNLLATLPESESADSSFTTSDGRRPARSLKGEVEFRNLTFVYSGANTEVLRDISLTIKAGESLGVIGPVASGKSTLAALIPRLYLAPQGMVFIDGVDVRDWSLNDLRGQIGYVPQESFLFSDRLGANLRFGAPNSSAAETAQAAKWAALDEEVAGFSEGYETIVGERGITLSGGQKQRASIARALLVDPRIIILDDATSAVDTETEAKISASLRETLNGRTSLIISHRISAVRRCDRILYLQEGKIAELGSHEALLRNNGPYAEMSRMQSLEEQLSRAS